MSFSYSFVTLGRIREDLSALPHIPCSPCSTGFEIPVPFLDCGNKDIGIGLHPTALEHLVELPFSERGPHLEIDRSFKMPYLSQLISTSGIKRPTL